MILGHISAVLFYVYQNYSIKWCRGDMVTTIRVFAYENQVRPLKSISHIFKTSAQLSILISWHWQSKRRENRLHEHRCFICFICPLFCCQMHSTWRHHSLMPVTLPPSIAVDLIQQTWCLFYTVRPDRVGLLYFCLSIGLHCYCRFYSATCPDSFWSTSFAEIPAAVVESERVADVRQVPPL